MGPPDPIDRVRCRELARAALEAELTSLSSWELSNAADAVLRALEPTLAEADERNYSSWEHAMGEDL